MSMLRRQFLYQTAATAAFSGLALGKSELDSKQRVDRALAGKDVDRPPFSLWHHFGLKTPEEHAKRTLEFHAAYRTDIVKVMSDFPYPKAAGKWYELKVEQNPFAPQIQALELIRDGLNGQAYFLETIFNPWNVAQKLASPEEFKRLKQDNPAALMNALDVITQSEINHAKRAFAAGAAGALVSVANANAKEMTVADYEKFSRPFDKKLMAGISGAKLNFLHLHVEPTYLSQFHGFEFPVINYSDVVSGIPIAEVRKQFPSSVIAGGIDEVNYKKLSAEQMREQWKAASSAAGKNFILTPGCSVPNDSTTAELARLPQILNA